MFSQPPVQSKVFPYIVPSKLIKIDKIDIKIKSKGFILLNAKTKGNARNGRKGIKYLGPKLQFPCQELSTKEELNKNNPKKKINIKIASFV